MRLEKMLASRQTYANFPKKLNDPQNLIQANLVTKDGPLADELAKTRQLSVRVGSKIAGMKRSISETDLQTFVVGDSSAKLQRALQDT